MGSGFLTFSRADSVLDFAAVALVFVLMLFIYSIYTVKLQRNYQAHKRLQLILAAALVAVLLTFEIDVRIFGWKQYAEQSPYFDGILFPLLYAHIAIATSTVVLWTWTIWGALKHFDPIPKPNQYSRRHKFLARISSLFMLLTIATAWGFFYVAFVAQ